MTVHKSRPSAAIEYLLNKRSSKRHCTPTARELADDLQKKTFFLMDSPPPLESSFSTIHSSPSSQHACEDVSDPFILNSQSFADFCLPSIDATLRKLFFGNPYENTSTISCIDIQYEKMRKYVQDLMRIETDPKIVFSMITKNLKQALMEQTHACSSLKASKVLERCIEYKAYQGVPSFKSALLFDGLRAFGNKSTGVAAALCGQPDYVKRLLTGFFSIVLHGNIHIIHFSTLFDESNDPQMLIFAQKNLRQCFIYRLREQNQEALTETGIYNALKLVFVDLSLRFADLYSLNFNVRASLFLKIDERLWCLNVGDAKTLLVENQESMSVMPLSCKTTLDSKRLVGSSQGVKEHKFSLLNDARIGNILASGGNVTMVPMTKDGIVIQVGAGISEVLSNEQIAFLVTARLKKGESPSAVATALVGTAYHSGSRRSLAAAVFDLSKL